jgi:uncharacterized membrane protein
MITRTLLGGILAGLAFFGMIDSAYIGIKSLEGTVLPCTITHGCDEVLSSPYARVGGVSIAWLGLAFYGIITVSGMFVLFGFFRVLRYTLVLACLAFSFSLGLIYLQARVIHAFCDYCLLSALLVSLIFITHLVAKPWKKLT